MICADLLICAGILIVIALTLDFLQYAYRTAAWGRLQHIRYKQSKSLSDPANAPRWINWPTLFLFWTKSAVTLGAYIVLLIFISGKLSDETPPPNPSEPAVVQQGTR